MSDFEIQKLAAALGILMGQCVERVSSEMERLLREQTEASKATYADSVAQNKLLYEEHQKVVPVPPPSSVRLSDRTGLWTCSLGDVVGTGATPHEALIRYYLAWHPEDKKETSNE